MSLLSVHRASLALQAASPMGEAHQASHRRLMGTEHTQARWGASGAQRRPRARDTESTRLFHIDETAVWVLLQRINQAVQDVLHACSLDRLIAADVVLVYLRSENGGGAHLLIHRRTSAVATTPPHEAEFRMSERVTGGRSGGMCMGPLRTVFSHPTSSWVWGMKCRLILPSTRRALVS